MYLVKHSRGAGSTWCSFSFFLHTLCYSWLRKENSLLLCTLALGQRTNWFVTATTWTKAALEPYFLRITYLWWPPVDYLRGPQAQNWFYLRPSRWHWWPKFETRSYGWESLYYFIKFQMQSDTCKCQVTNKRRPSFPVSRSKRSPLLDDTDTMWLWYPEWGWRWCQLQCESRCVSPQLVICVCTGFRWGSPQWLPDSPDCGFN